MVSSEVRLSWTKLTCHCPLAPVASPPAPSAPLAMIEKYAGNTIAKTTEITQMVIALCEPNIFSDNDIPLPQIRWGAPKLSM